MKNDANEFVNPKVEIVKFEENDILTTSMEITDGGIRLPDDEW